MEQRKAEVLETIVIDRVASEKRAPGPMSQGVAKKAKGSRLPGGRLSGESDQTEPDSEDDSLFGADDFEDFHINSSPGLELEPSLEELTQMDMVQRRLQHLKSLKDLYKIEYWGLLEELRTRHCRYEQKSGDEKKGAVGSAEHADGEHNLRKQLKYSRKRGNSTDQPGTTGDVEMAEAATTPLGVRDQGSAEQDQAAKNDPVNGAKERGQQGIVSISPPKSDVDQNLLSPFTPEFMSPTAAAARNVALAGDEVRGYGSGDELWSYSDVEGALMEKQLPDRSASKQQIQKWRSKFRSRLGHIQRLEQAASGSSARDLDRRGAIACLCGRHNRFVIKTTAVSMGRATEANQVDIDLSNEGDARKVSRNQAHVALHTDGWFKLKNVGRRSMLINNRQVDQGQMAVLNHLSLIEVGGVRLLFMVNHIAVKRALMRTAQLRN